MIQRIEKSCNKELEAVKPAGSAAYNEIKGVFNEAFLGWLIDVRSLIESAGDDPVEIDRKSVV